MKFNFRLKPILNIKMQKEDILKAELGRVLEILNKENKKLELMVCELRNYIIEYKELLKETWTVHNVNSYNAYFDKQKKMIEIQRENVNKAKENADKIRKELINVTKEKKMLEKLEEKKRTAFNRMLLSEEQKLIDEIVSYKQNVKLVEVEL
jgi:flagellar FliJ protein